MECGCDQIRIRKAAVQAEPVFLALRTGLFLALAYDPKTSPETRLDEEECLRIVSF